MKIDPNLGRDYKSRNAPSSKHISRTKPMPPIRRDSLILKNEERSSVTARGSRIKKARPKSWGDMANLQYNNACSNCKKSEIITDLRNNELNNFYFGPIQESVKFEPKDYSPNIVENASFEHLTLNIERFSKISLDFADSKILPLSITETSDKSLNCNDFERQSFNAFDKSSALLTECNTDLVAFHKELCSGKDLFPLNVPESLLHFGECETTDDYLLPGL